jgi:hypothetical protein
LVYLRLVHKIQLMRLLLILLIFFIFQQNVPAQSTEIEITVIGYGNDFKLKNNKIFEVIDSNHLNHVATVRENKIYKSDSISEKHVLYTIVGEKVYKTAVIKPQNLLFYVKDKTIYLRTKKGGYEPGAWLSDTKEGRVLGYIEPLEYFALQMAIKRL